MTQVEAMVEVRCQNIVRHGHRVEPCNRLILRLPPDMLPLFPSHVVLWCDKCNKPVGVRG